MYKTTSRDAYALSIWKKRWTSRKKRDIILIAALGICFTAFFGTFHILNPSRDSLLAIIILLIVFPCMIMHEIKHLHVRKDANAAIVGRGFLQEKNAFSEHEIVRSKHTRGCYATVRTEHGDIEVLCDSITYARSNPGDLLLIVQVENDSRMYAVAADPHR